MPRVLPLLLVAGLLSVQAVCVAAVAPEAAKPKLKHVASRAHLQQLLKKRSPNYAYGVQPVSLAMVIKGSEPDASVNTMLSSAGGADALAPGHSETNVQVIGVDEGDSVKTDGRYIYQIQDNAVRIVRAVPGISLAQAAVITQDDNGFQPLELMLDGQRLVVIGSLWKTDNNQNPMGYGAVAPDRRWFNPGISYSVARIYDVSTPETPVLEREFQLQGGYISSRRIGDALYLLSRTYPRAWLYGTAASGKAMDLLPNIIDSSTHAGKAYVPPARSVLYFPDFVEPDYVVVAGLRLDKPEAAADVQTFLGAGELVYSSIRNLYLSSASYGEWQASTDGASTEWTSKEETRIYKFSLNNGSVRYENAARVAGTVLNQFSMDEYQGNFRIATTSHNGSLGTNSQTNQLTVLDERLSPLGQVGDLAKGEQIYAARFVGDRCYLVTFRTTDPLFVLDLKDPAKPFVAGELKMPGYSQYLHPFKDRYLIGVGKEAIELPMTQNADTTLMGSGAYYQGLKVSLFDVGDPANPVQLHSISLGDRGSDSPLLWDHKAIWFDEKRQLLGFPLTLAKLKSPFSIQEPWQYGEVVYAGAHVYSVDPLTGFEMKLETPGEGGYDWSNSIQRIITIDNSLYTVAVHALREYNLLDFTPIDQTALVDSPSNYDNGENLVPVAIAIESLIVQ